ncbi:MAG: cation:proton antiporter [Ignavibacteriaceae bacterium]
MIFTKLLADIPVDPLLSKFVIIIMVIILIGYVLRLLKQPYIIAYIIVGIIIGPRGFELFTDEKLISNLGSFGLVLLLFFVGMEISLPKLISMWKISIIGTLLQIILSILAVWVVGLFFGWELNRIVLIGFVISLSSTAVVIKLLQERGELNTRAGQNVVAILLAQDVFVIIMLIVIYYLGGKGLDIPILIKQLIGAMLIIGIIIWLIKYKRIKLPFNNVIAHDHEMQVFVAFILCFGFSILIAFFNLSSALGAFVAGLIVSTSKSTEWVHRSLHSFRIMFLALFFVSIGMLIDTQFIWDNIVELSLLVGLVFLTNSLINAFILKLLKESWKESFYAGVLLSQIGEFSFILAATGYYSNMINLYGYQLSISLISLTLLLSPFWIFLGDRLILKIKNNKLR